MNVASPQSADGPAASGYGPGEAPRWEVYSKCTHCGLCLNSCPTYRELGLEMDSPRGRIYQMVQVATGRMPVSNSFVRHIDLCLDCRACETACPSGVEYGRLVETARGQIQSYYQRPFMERTLRRFFLREVIPHSARLKLLGSMLRLYQRSGLERWVLNSRLLRRVPGRLANVARLSPRMETPFFYRRLGTTVPAAGPRKYRVAFFAGCIANLSFARLNDATIRVLAKNGCEVVIPKAQGCCGALQVHAGLRDVARNLASHNIKTFNQLDCDAVVTNAAGCGSVLKEYPQLFEEEQTKFLEPARKFSSRMRDVSEFLAGIELNRDMKAVTARVTYQDPCHLGHAQRVRKAPRQLLKSIPGLELVELKESEVCCGSAGIYNVVQNEMAERLLASKMRRVDETEADTIVSANPGCMLQLRAGIARSAKPERRVMHVVELLDQAYDGLSSGWAASP
jgi:glycolate dehydrogenase iron-sulfur subunit